MAYKQEILDKYRSDALAGKPFVCATCPYCNGQCDSLVRYIRPSTKPDNPWNFWNHVLGRKYQRAQSKMARHNLGLRDRGLERGSEGEHRADVTMLVLGPMVDQSELPFRMLCREYGATLAYTPMLHSKSFQESAVYRRKFFTTTSIEKVRHCTASAAAAEAAARSSTETELPSTRDQRLGQHLGYKVDCNRSLDRDCLIDRPCIVQFCGHDPETVLQAARLAVRGEHAEPNPPGGICHVPDIGSQGSATSVREAKEGEGELYYQCDAVDINLGCPQGIARRGHYGSFLMEDWDLIHTIIHTLHVELEVPVTAKIRVFDCPDTTNSTSVDPNAEVKFDELLTIYYAQMIRDAGAQLLCVHGRTRAMKGQNSGLADLELVRRIRLALGGTIPVISNGNVMCYQDVLKNLVQTGCEGHMCAEPLLWDPTLFSDPDHPVFSGRLYGANKKARLAALNTALDYISWLRRYPVDIGMVKTHLFKMCYHSYELHTSFRDFMSNLKTRLDMAHEDGISAMDAVRETCDLPEENIHEEDVDVFVSQVEAIEGHLRALVKVELSCDVEEEQPKTARERKAESRTQHVDVFEEEGCLGFDF
ncbi:unnamed protein product [Phytomonas sp. EM1]|nr:unnamed protein product [Phytomonas sp. EM1]|eukprot:CCW65183.1 unnamed protein product [Phytomonas sp. isolate EM1]